jgi:glycogen synthase
VRVLTLTNVYPPDYIGGYELHCAQAVDGLRRLGHHVEVLTVESDMAEPDPLVHRVLRWHRPPPPNPGAVWKGGKLLTYLRNHRAAQRVTARARPDLAMCWSPARVGLACLAPACAAGVPSVLFADDWSLVAEWRLLNGNQASSHGNGRRRSRVLRSPLRRIARPLHFSHLVAVSEFVKRTYRELGFPTPASSVIHQGARFRPPELSSLPEGDPDTLIFVGRLERIKGVHLAVDVLDRLHRDHGRTGATLTIVGRTSSEDSSYRAELDDQIRSAGLTDHVAFAGSRPTEQVFKMLPRHRVLLFTSLWEEPGPATTIEALGHGVPVVSTDVGGMPEYVRDGVDGFVVPRDQPAEMAAAAARILGDGELWRRFRRAGSERVSTHFSDDRFVGEVEDLLQRVQSERRAPTGS